MIVKSAWNMGRCEYCKATKKKNVSDGISFHRFPKDQAQALLWLKNLGKENWQPHQFSVLCSAHFTPDCFKKYFNRSTLHEGRVPTIFNDGNKIVTHATEGISSIESFGEGGDVSNYQDVSMEITGSNNAEGSWNHEHFNPSTLHEGQVPTISDDEDEIVTHATEEISSTESFGEGGDVLNCQDESMETTGSNSAEGTSNQEHDGAQSWRQFENEEDLGLLSSPIEAGPSETAAEASTSTATPKRRQYLNHDHTYEDSPTTTAKKLHLTKKKLFAHKKEIRVMRQRVKRLKKSVTSLKDVVTKLKEVNLISESSSNALSAFEDVPLQVFSRMLRNHKKGTLSREKYPPDLRCFALTLHFYSPKAYDYVRQTFKLALPHPDILRAWYSNVNAEPGFTEESFKTLEFKVAEALEAGKEIVCALIMDEMGIKKGCQRGRDGKVRGHVEIGVGAEGGDHLMEANNCLVMLVVPLDSNWKLPVGYFLVRGLNAEEKRSLVTETLKRLHQVGVRVCSLTLDGPNDHFRIVHLLGANLKFKEVEPHPRFPHPVSTEPDINVMLDPCHMLKNIRNCLAEYEVLLDDNNQSIKWSYIDKLARLQQNEGLRLANKLRLRHVDFKKEIMKVYLAAQTLSSSVADALEFCWKVLGLADFKGCEATVRFIRYVDNTTILFATSTKHARVDRYDESVYEEVDNMRVKTKYDLDESPENVMEEFLHFPWSASTNSTEFSEQTIGYIAGFVVRSLRKKVKCVDCLVACVASDSEISNDLSASRVNRTALIVAKTRGGLIVPSPSVIKICTAVEVLFRRASNCNSGRPPHEPNFPAVLSTKAFQELVSSGYELFPDLKDHLIDSYSPDACGNHVISLTKKILSVYIEIRMFRLTKNYALSVTGTNMRHFFTRQIIWAHQ